MSTFVWAIMPIYLTGLIISTMYYFAYYPKATGTYLVVSILLYPIWLIRFIVESFIKMYKSFVDLIIRMYRVFIYKWNKG